MASTMLPGVPVDPKLAKLLTEVAGRHRDEEQLRDQLVRRAIREGGSLREVGALVGLSHAGVKRIVERGK